MKRLLFFLFLSPFLLSGTDDAGSSKLSFFAGSPYMARDAALDQGKLYFVDFVASWCQPCALMDETVYRDPKVINYISKSYIPVKVDIDDFDGYVLKQKYNVKVLPTILIFDSEGQMLARYEEAMGSEKLMGELKKYDLPKNRKRKPGSNTNPVPTPTPTPPPAPAPVANVETEAAAGGSGLYIFSVKKPSSKGFGVQTGVFAEYANVLLEAEKLEARYKQPIVVNINKIGTKTVYKVIVGNFSSREKAAAFSETAKKNGLSGFITDLSKLK